MKFSKVLVLCCLFLVMGCDQSAAQKIDGSSKEAYQSSLQKMADGLDESEKEAWKEGLVSLILERYPLSSKVKGLEVLALLPQAMEAAPSTMNGVTLVEILSRGKTLLEQKRNRIARESDAAALQEKKRQCLQSKVKASNPELSKDMAYVRVDIHNGLDWPISGLRLRTVISSEGRSVPWADEKGALSVDGGIEPGETRNISTYIGGISRDAPKNDLKLDVSVLDVADAETRLYVKDVRIVGWNEEPTSHICEEQPQ